MQNPVAELILHGVGGNAGALVATDPSRRGWVIGLPMARLAHLHDYREACSCSVLPAADDAVMQVRMTEAMPVSSFDWQLPPDDMLGSFADAYRPSTDPGPAFPPATNTMQQVAHLHWHAHIPLWRYQESEALGHGHIQTFASSMHITITSGIHWAASSLVIWPCVEPAPR